MKFYQQMDSEDNPGISSQLIEKAYRMMKSNNHTLWKVLHEKISPKWFHSVFLDRSRNYLYGIDYEPIEEILPELNKIVIKEKPDKLDFLAGENAQFIKYVIESYREQMKVCWDASSKKDKFWEQFFKNDESWRKVIKRKGSDSDSQHSEKLSNINSKEIESNMHHAENPQNISQSGISDRKRALRSEAEATTDIRADNLLAAEEVAASRRRAKMLQNELKNVRNDLVASGHKTIVLEGRNELLVKFIKDCFVKVGNENEANNFDRALSNLRKIDGKELQSLGIDKVLLSKKSELLAKMVIHTTSLIKGVEKSTNTSGPDYEDLPVGDAEAFSTVIQATKNPRQRRPSNMSRIKEEKSRNSISKHQASKQKIQQQSSHLLRQKKHRQANEPSAQNVDFSVKLEEVSVADNQTATEQKKDPPARIKHTNTQPRKKSVFYHSEQGNKKEILTQFIAMKKGEVEVEENEEVATKKASQRSPSPDRITDLSAEFAQPVRFQASAIPKRPKDMYEVGLEAADPKALLNRIMNSPQPNPQTQPIDSLAYEPKKAQQRPKKARAQRNPHKDLQEKSHSGPNEVSNEISSLDKNNRLVQQNFFDDPSIKSAKVFHSIEAKRKDHKTAAADDLHPTQDAPARTAMPGRKMSVMSTLPMSFDPNLKRQPPRNTTSQGFGHRHRAPVASPLQSPASIKKRFKIKESPHRPEKEKTDERKALEVRKDSIDIASRDNKRTKTLQPINNLAAAENSGLTEDSDASLDDGKDLLITKAKTNQRSSRKRPQLLTYVTDTLQIAQAQDPKMGMYFKLTPNIRLNKLLNGAAYSQVKHLDDIDRQVFVYLSRQRGERNRAHGEEKLKQLLQEKTAEVEKMKSRPR